MNEEVLRHRLNEVREKYGTPIMFIANKLGVTREHLSRWINNDSYIISDELKSRIAGLDILQ